MPINQGGGGSGQAYDSALGADHNVNDNNPTDVPVVSGASWVALTATGSTPPQGVGDKLYHTIEYVVSGLAATSPTSIVLQAERSNTGTNWVVEGAAITVTDNLSAVKTFIGAAHSVRLKFQSETGSSIGVVTPNYRGHR